MIVTESGKNVYPEEIEDEFQLFEEIDQILIRGYIHDKKLKIERIEALIHPNPEYKNEKGETYTKEEMKQKLDTIILEVNQRLQPYQKIDRLVILDEPLEMTTTKKIKRGNL